MSDLINSETFVQLGQVMNATEITAWQRNVLYVAIKELLDNPNDDATREKARKVVLAVEKQLEA